MNFTEQIERIEKAHHLINSEKTGTPISFADKLGISLNQLYKDLEFFKSIHAVVKYCEKKETFYYAGSINLDFVSL